MQIYGKWLIFYLLMKNHWIELKCFDVSEIFKNVELICHLNHFVNSNLI